MPAVLPRLETDVGVWYARTDALSAAAGSVADRWLTDRERVRFARFQGYDDRDMFLLGRVMARSLVAAALGIDPHDWSWGEGPHGRPEIASPDCDLHFNLAHSAGLVACALSRDREVGVDVEDLRRRPVDPAVVRRYCAPDEAADIRAHGDAWHDRFLRYWTLKEAYLKARGLGISMPLAEIAFSLDGGTARVGFIGSLAGSDDRWSFHMEQPTERHILAAAAAAASGPAPAFRIAPLPLEWLHA